MSQHHQHQHQQPPYQHQQQHQQYQQHNQTYPPAPYPGQEKHVAHQPAPTQGMMINPKNVKNMPIGQDGRRDWSFGLCSCCGDMSTCCLACFCPCVVYGQNKARTDYLFVHNRPDPDGDAMCTGDCCFYFGMCTFFGFGWILQFPSRGTTRARYGIRGNACGDCFAAACCHSCGLVQESREIALEEQSLQHHH